MVLEILKGDFREMKTLSLDLSTKSSGWSIFKDKVMQDSGCIVYGDADV